MMFCPDGKTNLDDVPVDQPCPGCGCMRRSANASAGLAAVQVMTGEISLKLTKGEVRDDGGP